MPALAQCDAFAYIYDQAGDPAPDVLVVLKRVLDASGNPILLGPKTTVTDSAGSFHFTLPEFATAFISARASALWNCPDGRAFKVPLGPSGELVPDFSLPASTLVEPPLVYVGDVLSIPKASATQDGYLSAADFAAFEAGGADVGVSQINTGAGLTGGPITETGTIALAPISGVAGSWLNPTSISINAYGQIIAITATADTTAPVITLIASTPNSSGATITWHTDDFSDSQVEYSTDLSYSSSTTLDSTPVQSHNVLITGTPPSTTYNYRVKSRNTAGLLATSGNNTFTTTIVTDTTPPVITLASTPVTVITETSATINWTTNENADSQVEYSTDTSYGTPTVPPIFDTPSGVTVHAVPLSGLTLGTVYHYRVKSKDPAGNPAIPVTGTFTTAAPAAPDVTTGLVSYWKFEETSGTRFDAVGPNDMTVGGTVGTAPGILPSTLAATSGPSANGYLFAADDPSQSFFGSMSIAGWLAIHTVTSPPTQHYLLSKYYTGGYSYDVGWIESPPTYQFTVTSNGTDFTYAQLAGTPIADTFVFLVAVFDSAASQIRISVNGGTPATTPFVGPILTSTTTFGILTGDGQLSDARVDELGLWGIALTPTQIAYLHNGGAGRTHPFS